MQSDPWISIRHICDQFVYWQAPAGGFDVEVCPYHRDTPFGKPSAFGQDIHWVIRSLYAAYDLLHDHKYKVAADRYAIFFIACLCDETPAWALGAALDPCFTLYRQYNPEDVSLEHLWVGLSKAKDLYRWLLGHRTDEPNYFNCGYPWSSAHPDEDVGFGADLCEVGRGVVGYHKFFRDEDALQDAQGLARYFLSEFESGTMNGIWSSELGTWLIGPRHCTGFENLIGVYADEAGWSWLSYFASIFLLRLHDSINDETFRDTIRSRCLASLRWVFDCCQFSDGSVGMCGQDDKWLGMTATAILQYLELYQRGLIDLETHQTYYPKAMQALMWLREMSDPMRFPPDGYILVTSKSKPWPGWNTTTMMAHIAEGLMNGPALESLGSSLSNK